MFKPTTATFILYAWTTAFMPSVIQAADEYSDCKVIRSLPKTTAEMDRLHRDNSGNQCEPLGEGESLETTSYSVIHTARGAMDKTARPAMRFGILSVGLIMDTGDKADLPLASGSKILDYMATHYVSIQVRQRRDLVSGKQYFHHRPLAATANFRGSKVTQPFDKLVTTAVRDFRSVGLFSKAPADRAQARGSAHARAYVSQYDSEIRSENLQPVRVRFCARS